MSPRNIAKTQCPCYLLSLPRRLPRVEVDVHLGLLPYIRKRQVFSPLENALRGGQTFCGAATRIQTAPASTPPEHSNIPVSALEALVRPPAMVQAMSRALSWPVL